MRSVTEKLPSLSVIIPTKNRQSDLERTVKSVLRQSVLANQLVVVDQSDTNAGHARLQAQISGAALDGRVELLYIHNPAISGGAAARNRALEIAGCEVCLFLDDDVELETDFVEQLLQVYGDHAEAGGVSGVITNYAAPKWPHRAWRAIFARGPFHDERQWIYWNSGRLWNSPPIPVRKFGGGLMSFRAEIIRSLRFDENLQGVSDGEDIDFCMRVKKGTLLLMNPRARLAHLHSSSGRLADHWLRRTVRGNHYLYWRHWNNGLRNRACFFWLTGGYLLLAALGCARRASLEPWDAMWTGMKEARQAARGR